MSRRKLQSLGQMNRRALLSGMAATVLGASGQGAMAETAIDRILNTQNRDSWNDQFDARSSNRSSVASSTPIFAPETIDFIQQAIAEYESIVAAGG